MILSLLIILTIISLAILFCAREDSVFATFAIIGIIGFMACIFGIGGFIKHVDEVNKLKSENINMIPISLYNDVYKFKVEEFEKITAQIKLAIDKNKFQVEVKNLNGVQIHLLPMSSAVVNANAGLGDIERGGAEKLKLLEALIDKQHAISNDLVATKLSLIQKDFWGRNAMIMQLEGSIFDGYWVRLLSIKSTAKPDLVMNNPYFPN
jgi:hypothetical protein